MSTLQSIFTQHIAVQPTAAFLISPETGATLSYAQFGNAVHALAARFEANAVLKGEHVGFFLPNGLHTTTIFLGVMIAGRVVVPFNLLSKGSALAHTIGHSEVRCIFTNADHRATVIDALALCPAQVRERVAIIEIDIDQVPQSAPQVFTLPPVAASDAALLMYTSGTTGQPKGALLTHTNLLHTGATVAQWHGLSAQDRVLSSLPLYHINGQCIATIAPFISGGSIITPHKFSVSLWWQWVRDFSPTWLNVVPTIIAYLLNDDAKCARDEFAAIRFARSASAPLPPEQHRAFEARFGIGVIEAMGMTECASMVFCNPQENLRRKYGTPGLPCGVEAKVIDAEGHTVASGATGELCLRGANVMPEYFNAPEKSKAAFDVHGWLRTGDLGHCDADGFYFVTGRIKELIIKGGENIAPREIDEALLLHPAVLEAVAYGVPDKNYGQTIHAAIVLKSHESENTCGADLLIAHCINIIGNYKAPSQIRFMQELPKGPSGKVQRLKLSEG